MDITLLSLSIKVFEFELEFSPLSRCGELFNAHKIAKTKDLCCFRLISKTQHTACEARTLLASINPNL